MPNIDSLQFNKYKLTWFCFKTWSLLVLTETDSRTAFLQEAPAHETAPEVGWRGVSVPMRTVQPQRKWGHGPGFGQPSRGSRIWTERSWREGQGLWKHRGWSTSERPRPKERSRGGAGSGTAPQFRDCGGETAAFRAMPCQADRGWCWDRGRAGGDGSGGTQSKTWAVNVCVRERIYIWISYSMLLIRELFWKLLLSQMSWPCLKSLCYHLPAIDRTGLQTLEAHEKQLMSTHGHERHSRYCLHYQAEDICVTLTRLLFFHDHFLFLFQDSTRVKDIVKSALPCQKSPSHAQDFWKYWMLGWRRQTKIY